MTTRRTMLDPSKCADREWMATAIASILREAGWNAHQIADTGRHLETEGRMALIPTERLVPRRV